MSKTTITFTQAGVESPVYVVTSLSSPPWQPLEMKVAEPKPDTLAKTFIRDFEGVAEGTYQYKIRIGEGHWVVDEHKETATDEHGNRNNVIRVGSVKPAIDVPITILSTPSKGVEYRKDSTISSRPSSYVEKANGHSSPGDNEMAPLFPHESTEAPGASAAVNKAPLFSHEEDEDTGSEDDEEFALAPLLPHESGYTEYEEIKRRQSRAQFGPVTPSEPVEHVSLVPTEGEETKSKGLHQEHAPTFSREHSEDEGLNELDGYEEAPMLPHERASMSITSTSSEKSSESLPFLQLKRSGSTHESDSDLFMASQRPAFFRARSSISTLPNALPRTDAEDENLKDPSLEQFPTGRDKILERVSSIHLPDEDVFDDGLHSPQLSVQSQACSSVDLAPVKSYISLASVPEAENSSDEADEEDAESLPSPTMFVSRQSSSRFLRDDRQRPGLTRKLVGSSDGADDLIPISPMTTRVPSWRKTSTNNSHDFTHTSGSQIRQPQESDTSPFPSMFPEPSKVPDASEKDTATQADTITNKSSSNDNNDNMDLALGIFGKAVQTCVGDRKRATTTAIALAASVGTYYLVHWFGR